MAASTTRIRAHTDIAPELGLTGVDAVREAERRLEGRIDIQQVAFPQYGILGEPGTKELLEAALGAGVDVVGGVDPAGMDGDRCNTSLSCSSWRNATMRESTSTCTTRGHWEPGNST